MINVSKVKKSLGKQIVLDDISLNVEEGSIYGLVGPNGAGKTTLIKNLVGIYEPDCGDIYINNEKMSDKADIKKRIGYVADYQVYYPNYKIKDMINFFKSTYDSWDDNRFNKLENLFNLNGNKKIKHLSKGMKTQLAILLNLSIMPKVLIMDEPTSGLDPVIRREVLNLLVQEVGLNNTTIFISTHNLGELEQICNKIGIMNKGKILTQDSLDTMKENIRKVQVVFDGDIPKSITENKAILKIEKIGRVYQIIVKENIEHLIQEINNFKPLLVETIDMSLEEIFVYKMGGEGYEFSDFNL